jgi:hypothetical protein
MEPLTAAYKRELIVIVDSSVAPCGDALPSEASGINELADQVAKDGGVLRPGFRLRQPLGSLALPNFLPEFEESPTVAIDLSAFFRVEADEDRLEELAEAVRHNPVVISAYIQPPTELPVLNNMLPSPTTPPSNTPDFTNRQTYLESAAEGGVDARHAWSQAGGQGSDVKMIDIEFAWNLTHESLAHHRAPLLAGAPRNGGLNSRNHGTAVLGVTSAGQNGFGITGICPEANVQTITNVGGMSAAEAILLAADMLAPGDILVLEMHRPGPRHNFASRSDQRGFIAVEWWPYDLAAIQSAVSLGIIVVEAAGNGWEDLDGSVYDTNPRFPSAWQNPFRRTQQDSGAIIVGAGAPPPGTHGNNHGPARSRLDFSNYGAALDAQGWGREVTSCGYGDLQGGQDENLWYTDRFSGTSSATPMVAGALACVQGVRKANGMRACTPYQIRSLLRQNTGSLQQDGASRITGATKNPKSERIGNLPDLNLLIAGALNLP